MHPQDTMPNSRHCANPICARQLSGRQKRYCSHRCWAVINAVVPKRHPPRIWSAARVAYLQEHYATTGAQGVATTLRLSHRQVIDKARCLGLHLTAETYQRHVHQAAQHYMQTHNPMWRPEVQEKARYWHTMTAEGQALTERLRSTQQAQQREHPSRPERRLRAMLDNLGVTYEPSALIKPRLIVDIRIGQLIIQLDGEYWHGHPRFAPLIPRQIAQQKRDHAQDAYLHACGYHVVRLWESEVSEHRLRLILKQYADL